MSIHTNFKFIKKVYFLKMWLNFDGSHQIQPKSNQQSHINKIESPHGIISKHLHIINSAPEVTLKHILHSGFSKMELSASLDRLSITFWE